MYVELSAAVFIYIVFVFYAPVERGEALISIPQLHKHPHCFYFQVIERDVYNSLSAVIWDISVVLRMSLQFRNRFQS